MEDENFKHTNKNTMQFDIFDLIQTVIEKKRRLFKFLIIFFVLGVILAFLSPKEYSASAIILPQINSNKGLSKKYSKIASLVGIDLGQSETNNIVPTLYPIIVNSAPFQKAILQSKINILEKEEAVTVSDYISNYKKTSSLSVIEGYTLGLPGKILKLFTSKEKVFSNVKIDSTIFLFSASETQQIDYLNEQLSVTFDDIEGFVEINAVMDEPIIAAEIVNNSQELLQKFIIAYNIQKSNDELKFLEKRLEEAKEDYISKRASLGYFKDSNINVISSNTRNREEQLRSEYDLAYNMYSQLATQRESTELQVKKDTPIFTILKPAIVPITPSAPNKLKIILVSIFLGGFLGVFLILFNFYHLIFVNYFLKRES
jgi:uncharacterized protein involved in exopolysaccharide biosynthesis